MVRATAAGVAAMLVLTACTPLANDDAAPADPSGNAALAEFYDQELAWGECDGDFATSPREAEVLAASPGECAFLTVPLDYELPDGATASVAVIRIAASDEPIGSLLFNPGGPGGTGILGAIGAHRGLEQSRVTDRFDLVGFDPRGVGATRPAADCYSPTGTTRADELFPVLASRPDLTEEDTRAIFEQCAEGSGGADALAQMSTRTTAKDMDVLRAALGDEQLTYLGQSYGTRLGAVYAEEFPRRVRAMILDGAFDPTLATIDRFLASYTGFQAAFDAMAAHCAQDAACPLGTDSVTWNTEFQAIMRPLQKEPVPALDGQLVDFDTAIGAVILGLYTSEAWPAIIAGIAEVKDHSRGDILLRLATAGAPDPASIVNGNFGEAMFAINCMDEQRLSRQDLGRLRDRTAEVAPFMDAGVHIGEGARDGCEHWPAKPTLGFPYAQNIEGLPATLVVSFDTDPTTPHSGAIELADTLGSSLLTLKGAEHTIVSGGTNACVDEIAANYLIDLELPAVMPNCNG